jgi:hypothetical protein
VTLEKASDLLVRRILGDNQGLLALGLRRALAEDVANGAPVPTAEDIERLVMDDNEKYPKTNLELEDIYS